jgi:Phage portal protein, SPP1 Gp6-like
MALALPPVAAVDAQIDARLAGRIDDVRTAMEAEMEWVRRRAKIYLNWYSPPFNENLSIHDAWVTNVGNTEPLTAENIGLTRANFPIARAVVDIWTSLEAANPPTVRAEAERLQAPPPMLDQNEALRYRLTYEAFKKLEGIKSEARSAILRQAMRLDSFPLKHYLAVRRKNLYGFSWVKVIPDMYEKRPRSHVLRNPTVVFPIWSTQEPDEIEQLMVAHQMSARLANAKYGLGLPMKDGAVILGQDSARYRDLNDRWYDSTRTMVWVEELWWIDRVFNDKFHETSSQVSCITRVAGQIIPESRRTYKGWRHIPFVMYQNTDERDSYGWSDIAGVIDINDEFNRRMSQEGDIIGNYAAPRFQLLNGVDGRDVEMPGPFEMIPLRDQERIEQILTRIDVFPGQSHFDRLTDLLHRVSGLPPIVWGLIANAQTSGRALTASWKATEARLSPKLMANEQALRRWESIMLNYFRLYNWRNTARLFLDRDGEDFNDFRWEHPPMEPRDFQEVAMNAITRRDAGLTSTVKAMRETGDEAPEDTLEEVLAEFANPFLHPDKGQAKLIFDRTTIENAMMVAQLQQQGGQQPANMAEASAQQAQAVGPPPPPAGEPTAVPAQAGAESTPLPPAQEGVPQPVEPAEAVGPAGGPPQEPGGNMLTSGTLIRNGTVSNQYLETKRLG